MTSSDLQQHLSVPDSSQRSALQTLQLVDQAIRRDPAQRGLLSQQRTSLCDGHLAAAADHLSRFGRRAWILTGFYIPKGSPPAAETDGPPGAAFLAAALNSCGIEPRILTDPFCHSAVAASLRAYGLSPAWVHSCPFTEFDVHHWASSLWNEDGTVSHVIAVERVGPAHTPTTWSDPALARTFQDQVPAEHWNHCHNMRGEMIDAVTPPLHAVMEWVARYHPEVRTIGIGDGGNEIGMGAIPYAELRSRLIEPAASRIPCRIATDWTIVTGVSNWGAMALGASFCWLRQRLAMPSSATRALEEYRLQQLVMDGPMASPDCRNRPSTVCRSSPTCNLGKPSGIC